MPAPAPPPSAARLALCAALTLLGGCDDPAPGTRPVRATFGATAMTLDVPAGLEAEPLPEGGLRLARPDAGRRRGIYAITLTPGGGASPVPLRRTRGGGEDAIRYGLDRFEGGSGGPEVTLVAERRCGDASVRLRLDLQGEADGAADPDAVLALLGAARCAPRPQGGR